MTKPNPPKAPIPPDPPPGSMSHGMVGTGTLLSGLAATGALLIGGYQVGFKNPEIKENTDEKIAAQADDMSARLTELEARIEQAMRDVESANAVARAAERTLAEFTNTVSQMNAAPEFGARILPSGDAGLTDARAAGIRLTDVQIRRSGTRVSISAKAISDDATQSIGFYDGWRGIGVLDTGLEVKSLQHNVAGRGWTNRSDAGTAELRPGVPVLVEWEAEVPESATRFQSLEIPIINNTTGQTEPARFGVVVLPAP